MNDIHVNRGDLISKLKANRDAHREEFLKAQEGFRARVIEELDAMLSLARKGDNIRLGVGLAQPQDHTKDYDRVIAMLEMTVDDIIEIDEHNFNMYVLDEWGWSAATKAVNSSYTGTTY